MEADKVDKFLLANESKFPDYEIPIHRLLDLPPEKEAILAKNHFKSPICMLSVSCFLGYFGLDRFLIGDWGKGIIKPKSVIRISLCRTAKRNPLIFPI